MTCNNPGHIEHWSCLRFWTPAHIYETFLIACINANFRGRIVLFLYISFTVVYITNINVYWALFVKIINSSYKCGHTAIIIAVFDDSYFVLICSSVVEHLGNFFLKSVIDNTMVNIFVQIGYNLKNVSPDKFLIFMFIMFYFMWYFTFCVIYLINTYIVLALCA